MVLNDSWLSYTAILNNGIKWLLIELYSNPRLILENDSCSGYTAITTKTMVLNDSWLSYTAILE